MMVSRSSMGLSLGLVSRGVAGWLSAHLCTKHCRTSHIIPWGHKPYIDLPLPVSDMLHR